MYSRIILILLVTMLLMAATAMAQPPDTLWTRTYGGSLGDYGESVQQTTDGGYVIAGYTSSYGAGDKDVYLIKTDASGNELWYQTYGGSDSDYGYDVQQTSDGGYIMAGQTASFGAGSYDVYLIKTDVQGNELWHQTFGGTGSDGSYSVQQTLDGGYIVAGRTESYGAGSMDIYLIKTDASGDTLWTRTFGGSGNDRGYSVQQTSDGGYIMAGQTASFGAGSYDVYLIKTDVQGNELWHQTYGGAGGDYGESVQQTADGGYITTGYTGSFGVGGYDVWLIKTDALGDTLWTRTYGGSDSDYGYDVQQTAEGGYIIAGETTSYGAGSYDAYLIKTDASGNEEWTQTYGGTSSDRGWSVQQTQDGSYIIAGRTLSFGVGSWDVYLIRLEGEVSPDLSVTLTPHNPPIQIPASGGSFEFNAAVTNNETTAQTFDAWIMATLPNGSQVGPLLGPVNLTLPGGESLNRDRTQSVPAGAPAGTYTYTANVGLYPTVIWDEDSFTFEKLSTGDGSAVPEWANRGESFNPWLTESTSEIPAEFGLLGNYPNPFNPVTAISYQLSAVSHVHLAVYDITGRIVAELINGWRDAGIHEVTFDGTALASGIYIYRLEERDFSASMKMVLMK